MIRIILSILFFICSYIASIAQEKHTITINFTGIKSNKGDLYIALYNKKKSFLKKPIKSKIIKVENLKATAFFKNIITGEYAVSAFHDINDNKKMDTKIFGIPKEPTGISNNTTGFMGPPKYKNAKFTVDKDISLTINIK